MVWSPVTGLPIQYSEDASGTAASGNYLKFYASGTTTPINMATDSTGATTLAKCQLNSLGQAINGSSAVFIPHIDQKYKAVLYPDDTTADANTFASAIWNVDGITPQGVDALNSVRASGEFVKEFDTMAAAIAATTLVVGDVLLIKDRANTLWDVVLSSGVTENGYNIVQGVGVGTLSYQLREDVVINVKAIGAVGDGSTDTTAAIQHALDLTNTWNTKKVLIPKSSGSYMVDVEANTTFGATDAALVFNYDGIELHIEKGAEIKMISKNIGFYSILYANLKADLCITGEGIIRGDRATFGGARTSEFGFGIDLQGCSSPTIRGITVEDCWGDGVIIRHSGDGAVQSSDIRVSEVICDNNRRNGMAVTSALGGYVRSCIFRNTNGTGPAAGIDFECDNNFNQIRSLSVVNNISHDNEGYGFAVSAIAHTDATNKPQGITLTGNTSYDNDKSGYFINRSRRVSLVGNTSERDGIANSEHGVHVRGSTTGGTSNIESEDIIISGNILTESGAYGVYIDSSSGTTPVSNRVAVIGNIIKSPVSHGIYGNSINASINNVISNNIIQSAGGSGVLLTAVTHATITGNKIVSPSARGISVNADSHYAVISGNSVEGAGQEGIRIDADSSNVTGNQILGCSQTTNNTYNGIEIRGDLCNVQMNTVRHMGGANQHKYGLQVITGATSNLVTNNDLSAAGSTGNFNDSGTTTVTTAANRV